MYRRVARCSSSQNLSNFRTTNQGRVVARLTAGQGTLWFRGPARLPCGEYQAQCHDQQTPLTHLHYMTQSVLEMLHQTRGVPRVLLLTRTSYRARCVRTQPAPTQRADSSELTGPRRAWHARQIDASSCPALSCLWSVLNRTQHATSEVFCFSQLGPVDR